MTEKKAKSRPAAKKARKKKSGVKGIRRQPGLHPLEVRKDISKMVEAHAAKMTQAVIGEGERGQLATVKYLFEVANIFPTPTDGSQALADDESFAETLLKRLNVPDDPVVADLLEAGISPARTKQPGKANGQPEESPERTMTDAEPAADAASDEKPSLA